MSNFPIPRSAAGYAARHFHFTASYDGKVATKGVLARAATGGPP